MSADTEPGPVLGDLILEALAATRDAMSAVYTYGRATDRDALDAARRREMQTQQAVWKRLLDVAPHEFGPAR